MDYQITFSDGSKAPFVVKPYTANGPKEPAAPTPLYSGAVSANTSLVVLGKGAFDYGEPIQKNFVHLLENFANKSRPAYPIQGQLWYKNADFGDVAYPSDPLKLGLYVYTGSTWAQIPTTNSTLQNNLDFGNFRGINVGDAINPQDALNKRTGDTLYVNVSGDSMAGPLNMSSNGITGVADINQFTPDMTQALNVASGDSRYVKATGGQMLGPLDMSNNKIVNLRDAVDPQDALNLRTARNLFVAAGPNGSVDGGTY